MGLTSAALTIAFHGGTNGRGRLKRSPARLTGGTNLFAGLPVRLGGLAGQRPADLHLAQEPQREVGEAKAQRQGQAPRGRRIASSRDGKRLRSAPFSFRALLRCTTTVLKVSRAFGINDRRGVCDLGGDSHAG